jgi:hypothetical protein
MMNSLRKVAGFSLHEKRRNQKMRLLLVVGQFEILFL